MSIKDSLNRIFNLITRGKDVQDEIPRNLDLEFDRLSRTLPVQGPHKKRKKGDGMEMFSVEPFRHGDSLRRVSRRYTEKDRQGRTMVVHNEAEVRHYYYMWQDNSPSMDYKSDKATHSPREVAGALITGLSTHLGTAHAKVGLLETGQWTQGRSSGAWMASRLVNDTDPHDVPQIQKRLSRDSSALLFSDGMWDLDQETPPIIEELDHLYAQGVSGWLVMILDPASIDFESKGHHLFEGMEGEDSCECDNISTQDYHRVLLERVEKLRTLTDERDFKLVVCRTDEPLRHVVDALYDMGPDVPERWPSLKAAPANTPAPKP